MPVAFVMDFDGGTAAQYDAVIADMDLGGQMPEGGIYHAAGATRTGWRVVDVWEADAPFEAFAADQIGPLSQRHGLAAPRMQRMVVDQVRTGGSADQPATFLQVAHLPGLDREAFHATDAKVLPLPDGLVFHVNGQTDDGWFVVDTWLSQEERDWFIDHRVRPAFADAPLTGEPVFEELAVYATMSRLPAVA
jgi:hypothetical protein